MRRHDIDPVSLLSGLLFAAIAVCFLLAAGGVMTVSPGVVVPLGLGGLVVATLSGPGVAAARRRRRRAVLRPVGDREEDGGRRGAD